MTIGLLGPALQHERYTRSVESKLRRWEAATDKALMIAAFLFFVAFAVPIIWWPGTPAAVVAACEGVVWVTWGAFVFDYGF